MLPVKWLRSRGAGMMEKVFLVSGVHSGLDWMRQNHLSQRRKAVTLLGHEVPGVQYQSPGKIWIGHMSVPEASSVARRIRR